MRLATYRDYVVLGTKFLSAKGVEEARISSERLLEKVTTKDKMSLLLEQGLRLSSGQRELFFDLLRKRAEFYPLQYLTGETGFRNLRLKVEEGVLIPRPETELLLDEVHRFMGEESSFQVLDIGAGSGNIALAVAQEFPRAEVWAVDRSEKALAVARQNAHENGLESRIHFLKSDLFSELADEKFDVIVSNPPYIPIGEKEGIQKEVRFEPEEALYGGESGLEVIERIFQGAKQRLKDAGYLILEIGAGQADDVLKLARENGFENVAVRKDYSDIERIVTFKKWKN